jgi:hypothetical protein
MIDGKSLDKLRELIEEVEAPKQEQRVLIQAWVSPVVAEAVRRVVFEMKVDKRVFIELVLAQACVEYLEPSEQAQTG